MPLITSSTSPATSSLTRIQQSAKAGFNQRLMTWQQILSALWKSPDPQAIVDLMGTDAKANFQASADEGNALAALSALLFDAAGNTANLTRIASIAAVVKPYTVNADGTVTITVVAPAAPTPSPSPSASPAPSSSASALGH